MNIFFVVNIYDECETYYFLQELQEKLCKYANSEFLTHTESKNYTCKSVPVKKTVTAGNDDTIWYMEDRFNDRSLQMQPDEYGPPEDSNRRFYEFTFQIARHKFVCETRFIDDYATDSIGECHVHRYHSIIDLINNMLALVDEILDSDLEEAS